jgi:hypothetical protein
MTEPPPVEDVWKAKGRFEVGVAILVVLSTLVAAGVGLLFAHASNQAEEASAAAGDRAVEAAENGLAADQRVDLALTHFMHWREHRARARSALEADIFDGAAGAAAEARRWQRLAARSERSMRRALAAEDGGDLDIGDASAAGAELDTLFPARFRALAHEDVHAEVARRDAANSLSAEWGQRTASYAAILTLLAVALYLFGFALAPQGKRLRGLFAAVGTGLLCLGLIFGPVRALSSPGAPDDAAAVEFGRGLTALQSAVKPSDYGVAATHLTAAISARPDFVEAYSQRAGARFLQGTPQFVPAASLTTPPALQLALADIRMARSLGQRTSGNLVSEGFYLFLLGIRTERPALLREGLAVTRAALAEESEDLIARFNLALTLLGLGRVDEARREYRDTLELLVDLDWWSRKGPGTGALTDLELVAEHGPVELVDEVRDIKEMIAGAMAVGKVPKTIPKRPELNVRAIVESGVAKVRLPLTDLSEEGMLSVHWYREEPPNLGWWNVPQLLGAPVAYYGEGAVQAPSYVAEVRRCLPDGRYRADVYLGSRLVGSGTAEYDGSGAAPFVDRDHGLAGCRPVGWDERSQASPLVRSYLARAGRSGLHLVRLDRTLWDSRDAIEKVFDELIEVPAGTRRHVRSSRLDVLGSTFAHHEYTYPDGEIDAAATTSTVDGSTVVAIVFGPPLDIVATGMTPQEILSSLALLDK